MKKRFAIIAALLPLLSLCACASISTNPYHNSYRPVMTFQERISQGVKLNLINPSVSYGTDIEKDRREMMAAGYRLVGEASFHGAEQYLDDLSYAKNQALAVQAAKVILYRKYTDTVSGQYTATVSTQPPADGASAAPQATGDPNRMVINTYTTRMFDIVATFWNLYQPPLGVYVDDLSAEQRKALGSNKGACITMVCKNSPAFRADILEGDIITRINGIPILLKGDVDRTATKLAGQTVNVDIVRGGQTLTKAVTLDKEVEKPTH